MPEPRLHFVGIGGVGMSALAQAARDRGRAVSGSDRLFDREGGNETFAKLRAQGVTLMPQDGTGPGGDCGAVIVSSAVEADNPDRRAAEARGIPVMHRAALLAEWVAGHAQWAVAGTCGKTTITGLLGWLLAAGGQDPLVLNGGEVCAWSGPGRFGSTRPGSGPAVFEADESDRSLLRFEPEWALISNISADHFALEESRRLFAEFTRRVRCGLILGSGVRAALGALPPRLEIVALEEHALGDAANCLTWEGETYAVPLPGRHNLENAALAVAAARRAGVAPPVIRTALAEFTGLRRRLELVGGTGRVFDDYAHNPAKISAAWRALAERAPAVIGVWRPHGFAPLANWADELTAVLRQALRPGDHFLILPVYYAGGSATRTLTAADYAARLAAEGLPVECVPDYERACERVRALAQPNTRVLCCGARDPDLPALARALDQALAGCGTGKSALQPAG